MNITFLFGIHYGTDLINKTKRYDKKTNDLISSTINTLNTRKQRKNSWIGTKLKKTV